MIVINGRTTNETETADNSNVTINIQQAGFLPWIFLIIGLIVLLSAIACCIYCCSKRNIRFVRTSTPNSSERCYKSQELVFASKGTSTRNNSIESLNTKSNTMDESKSE